MDSGEEGAVKGGERRVEEDTQARVEVMPGAAAEVPLRTAAYAAFDADPAPIVAFVRRLARRYRLAEPLDVLDVGCGPGRLLAEYAALGWRPVGLEPDDDFLAMARRLAEEIPAIEVRSGGFGDLDDGDRFDLITAINGPFAYLLDEAERRDALARSWRALRPGGVLLLDVPNLLRFADDAAVVDVERARLADGRPVTLLEEREVDLDDATYRQENAYLVRQPDGGLRVVTGVHEHAVLLPSQVRDLMARAGFTELATYNRYAARRPTRRPGERILVAGRKPR